MKSKFIKSLLAITLAVGLASSCGVASAYWHHGWGGSRVYVGFGPGYYGGGPYYGGYYGGGCRWIRGHWRYGYWVPSHRVCW